MLGEKNLDLRYAEPRLENYPVALTCLFNVTFLPADRNIKPDAPPSDVPRKEKGRGDRVYYYVAVSKPKRTFRK